MPKVIKDLEKRLIEEAEKQIQESGYGAMTIRSVAKSCGVGVGTVYNYFSSKDELLATYLLGDWNQRVTAINAVSTYSDSPAAVLRCMFDQLTDYADRHQAIFRDESAVASFSRSFNSYHSMLRDQMAAPLKKFCSGDFTAEFIAEALLTWTMAGKSFDEIYGILNKLF